MRWMWWLNMTSLIQKLIQPVLEMCPAQLEEVGVEFEEEVWWEVEEEEVVA